MYQLAAEFYPDYPDPMPAFRYLGGDYGKALLESALAAPQQVHGGRFLHRTIFDKAAALFRSMVKNHPLEYGNKRLGLTKVATFLVLNGYLFYPQSDDAVASTLQIARTEGNVALRGVARWLRENSLSVKQYFAMSPVEQRRWSRVSTGTGQHLRRWIGRQLQEIDAEVQGVAGIVGQDPGGA